MRDLCTPLASRILSLGEQLRDIRKNNSTLALGYTSGVFDMFHEGHANYIRECMTHCDILIVGVDADILVRQRKGQNRPFQSQEFRLRDVSLHSDYVFLKTLRSETYTSTLLPDFYFHSEENSPTVEKLRQLSTSPGLKRIISIPYTKNISTTRILHNQRMGAQAQALADTAPGCPAAGPELGADSAAS